MSDLAGKLVFFPQMASHTRLLAFSRGAVMIWKPKVTPMSELRPAELQTIQSATGDEVQVTQRTSLAKQFPDVSTGEGFL